MRRVKTSWIEGRPRVESGWWDWIGGNEGIPRKKGRWVVAGMGRMGQPFEILGLGQFK